MIKKNEPGMFSGVAVLLLALATAVDDAVRGAEPSTALVGGGTAAALAALAWIAALVLERVAYALLPAPLRRPGLSAAIVASFAIFVTTTVFVAERIAARHRDADMVAVTVAVVAVVTAWIVVSIALPLAASIGAHAHGLVTRAAAVNRIAVARAAWATVLAWGLTSVVWLAVGGAPHPPGSVAKSVTRAWDAMSDPDGNGRGLVKR